METRIDLHRLKKENYSSCSRFLLPSIALNPKITDFQSLKTIGFYNIFLYDETQMGQLYYPNSILMVCNPSISFHEENWTEFLSLLQNYKNYITYIDYGYLRYGIWFRIHEEFGKNLRYFYKLGQFSRFPKNYVKYLGDTEKRICNMDDNYRMGLARKIGVDPEDLEGVELGDIPYKEDYCLKF